MSIQIFKLVNGETVVSNVEIVDSGFMLIDPMVMVSNINSELGVAGIALYKWIPFTDEKVFIPTHSVVAIVPASEKLTSFYNKTWNQIRDSRMENGERDLYDSEEEATAMARSLKDFKGTIQ